MATLDIENLAAGYTHARREITVLRDLSAALTAGELVCLLGPNGVGKSTLMRTVSALQAPLRGRVLLNGEDVHQMTSRTLAKRLSVVLTDRVAIGMLSGYELVALGRYPYTNWAGDLSPADHDVIRSSISAVGAVDLAARNVGEMSDGERQKIMVARALAQETQVMVLDEITAFLDLPRRVEIMRILKHLANTTQRAILLSTHDLDLALRSADRIWLLPKGGPLHVGSPESLVLSGAFETAFQTEGVSFDAGQGAFRLHREFAGRICVDGEGVHAYWTARALERRGFEVVHPADATCAVNPRVRVSPGDRGIQWHLILDDKETIHDSLDEFLLQTPSLRSD